MTKLSNFIVRKELVREMLSEFVGTFLLVLINVAGPLNLQLSGVQDALLVNLVTVAGVFLGMIASMSNSGAHINPIVSTSFAARGSFPWKKVPYFIVAQYLGAFIGAAVAFINFSEAMASLDGGMRTFTGSPNATGLAFATEPDTRITFTTAVFDTMLCSALLLFAICAITDHFNSAVPVHLYAPFVSFAVFGILSAFSVNCGVAINPARDLAPRVFTMLAGYGTQAFRAHKGAYWIVATLVPHVGGFLGSQLYWFAIGLQKPGERERLADLALMLDKPSKKPSCSSSTIGLSTKNNSDASGMTTNVARAATGSAQQLAAP